MSTFNLVLMRSQKTQTYQDLDLGHQTMKLRPAFATASFATAILYAREDDVTTIVTTLAEESTTYVVVDGQC